MPGPVGWPGPDKDSRITECVRAGQGLLVPLVCTDGLSSPTWGGDGPSAWATLLPSLLQAGQGSCCSLWCSHPHLCGAAPFLGLCPTSLRATCTGDRLLFAH